MADHDPWRDFDDAVPWLIALLAVAFIVCIVMLTSIQLWESYQLMQLEIQTCQQGIPDCTKYGPYGSGGR